MDKVADREINRSEEQHACNALLKDHMRVGDLEQLAAIWTQIMQTHTANGMYAEAKALVDLFSVSLLLSLFISSLSFSSFFFIFIFISFFVVVVFLFSFFYFYIFCLCGLTARARGDSSALHASGQLVRQLDPDPARVPAAYA